MSRRPAKRKLSRAPKSRREPVRSAREALETLTGREQEVLAWIAEGMRDAEIGRMLGRSVRTIHKHVQHILAKLDTETRTGAARIALEGRAPGDGVAGETPAGRRAR